MSSAVLRRICSLSEPVSHVEKWHFLSSNVNVRQHSGDAHALLETLQNEFSTEQLESAKVVQVEDDGELILSPILSDGDSVFVPLRHSADEAPFDLMSEKGCLTSDVPPSIIAYQDWTATKYFGNSLGNILVAADIRSVDVLRSQGFSAAVIAGLDTLHGPQLNQLCGKRDFDRDSQTRLLPQLEEMQQKEISLTFAFWDVANLNSQVPENVQVIATRMARVSEYLGVDPEHLKVWRPTINEINEITDAANFGDRIVALLAIQSSLENSVFRLTDYFLDLRRPEDYGGAQHDFVAKIDRARQLNYESPELSESRDHFDRVFERTVVQPLLNEANSSSDSMRRVLLLTAAELTKQWHESNRFVRAARHGVLRCDDPRSGPAISEETNQRRLVVDQLLKIYRELHRKQ